MDENLYYNDFVISDDVSDDSGFVLSSLGVSSDVSSENEENVFDSGYSSIDYSSYFELIHEDILSFYECVVSEDSEVTLSDVHSDLRYILLILVVFLGITVFRGFHSLVKGL